MVVRGVSTKPLVVPGKSAWSKHDNNMHKSTYPIFRRRVPRTHDMRVAPEQPWKTSKMLL